jgi:hypothetical protein
MDKYHISGSNQIMEFYFLKFLYSIFIISINTQKSTSFEFRNVKKNSEGQNYLDFNKRKHIPSRSSQMNRSGRRS